MKTVKIFLIATAIIASGTLLFAQDQTEALKFSQRFPQSDARAMGAGNAFGAIGANIISASINPGSLALYKKSDFAFSLGVVNTNANSTYLGVTSDDNGTAFILPEVGVALTKNIYKDGQPVKKGWVSYTFSLATTRMNSYMANIYFEGKNDQSSVLYNYAQTANGTYYKSLSLNNVGGLAWDTYLIDTLANDPYSYIPIDTISRDFYQENYLKTRGSCYDVSLAFAGNYSDIIFIGASLTFPTINYKEERDFYESNLYKPSEYLASNYYRDLKVHGMGVRGNFGIVVKPIKYIRIGGSIQTPTFYSLNAEYYQEMSSSLITRKYTTSSQGEMDFNFTSPFRATGSLAIIAGKYGFVAVDYEFVDYSMGSYSSSTYQYKYENDLIENYYKPTSNIRIGGEIKYDIFSFRGGYGMYGSPYSSLAEPPGADASATLYSFGIGMHGQVAYLDFAYQHKQTKEYYLPYSLNEETMDKYNVSEVTGSVNDLGQNNFVLTFGVRF
jgi:hypothetical protein